MTADDTALLERAARQFKATLKMNEGLKEKNKALAAEIASLRRRNADLAAARDRAETDRRLLRERLNRPDALNAELWRSRAEFWEERARVLRLANRAPHKDGDSR